MDQTHKIQPAPPQKSTLAGDPLTITKEVSRPPIEETLEKVTDALRRMLRPTIPGPGWDHRRVHVTPYIPKT